MPGTAIGVLLKSSVPNMHAWADKFGCLRDERRWLMVMSHWGRRRSHSARGKDGSQEARPEMKWCFHVWIARSAAFRRWVWGGTRWKSTLFFLKASFRLVEHSLSRMWRTGAYPLCCKRLWQFVQAAVILLACRDGRGVDNIALLS